MKKVTLNTKEWRVLKILSEHYEDYANCLFFRGIAKQAHMNKKDVRRACRSLARKGLAAYERGLFDEDGKVAGSGYYCTKAGSDIFTIDEDDFTEPIPL